jgi:hypothetical protein
VTHVIRTLPLIALAAAFAMATAAHASTSPGPAGLPACTSAGNPGACRLPITNGDFAADIGHGWRASGFVTTGAGVGVLSPGAALSQPVAINTLGYPADAGYAANLRVMGESGDGEIEVRLALSDDQGGNAIPIASARTSVRQHEWTTVDVSGKGVPFAAPAHVLVTIENLSPSTRLQVDDVHVVEATDAY